MFRAAFRVAPIGVAVWIQAAWFAGLFLSSDPVQEARRDWIQYFETGHRLLGGDLQAIYPRVFDMPFPWVYPPYCIYLTAPLGLLTEGWAYVTCVVVQLVAMAVALALLRLALPAPRDEYVLAAGFVAASMPFNTTLIIGQASGLFLLVAAAALWTWTAGHRFAAGVLLALMFAKPNLGVFFPAALLAGGAWVSLAGMALGLVVMLAISLPLGIETWTDYVRTTHAYFPVLTSRTLMWKQITLYGFWRTVTGTDAGHGTAVVALWLVSVVPLAVATLLVWRRGRDLRAPAARVFGVVITLAIAANIYVQFYDGLLLAVPALAWYLERRSYHSRAAHALIGACIALLLVGGHLTLFIVQGGIAWQGPLIAIWLLAEAYDLLTTSPVRVEPQADCALNQTTRRRRDALPAGSCTSRTPERSPGSVLAGYGRADGGLRVRPQRLDVLRDQDGDQCRARGDDGKGDAVFRQILARFLTKHLSQQLLYHDGTPFDRMLPRPRRARKAPSKVDAGSPTNLTWSFRLASHGHVLA